MTEISKKQNNDDLEDKIQIFSNTDEKLKFLGKILNNESSKKILQLLIEKEMTANEVATQTKLSLPLALYHVNQMIKAGIVIISKTSTNGKNQPTKHYSAKPGIIILPEKAFQKAKESKSFSNSLKRIMKLASVGFAGVVTWFGTQFMQNTRNIWQDQLSNLPTNEGSQIHLDRDSPTVDIPPTNIPDNLPSSLWNEFWNSIQYDIFWSTVFTVIVVSVGLFLILYKKY